MEKGNEAKTSQNRSLLAEELTKKLEWYTLYASEEEYDESRFCICWTAWRPLRRQKSHRRRKPGSGFSHWLKGGLKRRKKKRKRERRKIKRSLGGKICVGSKGGAHGL